MPWQIYAASSNGDSIDAGTYEALHTTFDVAALFDLLEMHEVHQSWQYAAMLNAKERD